MPAFSNSPWSGSADYFNRVPRSAPQTTENITQVVQESIPDINNRVYQELINDRNFVKILKFNGCHVVISKGNSSAELSVFYHDQRPWEMKYNDLPVPHSWRGEEWHEWFDNEVFKIVCE
jgi:hypothetical protein